MRTATEVPQTKQNKRNKRKTLDRDDRVARAQVEHQKKSLISTPGARRRWVGVWTGRVLG